MATKRKSNVQLEPLHLRPRTYSTEVAPRTPYPFLTESPKQLEERDIKRLRMAQESGQLDTSPLQESPTGVRYNISPAEMTTACNAVLCQIDWPKVVQEVVGNDLIVIY